jgi:hypothetical protein
MEDSNEHFVQRIHKVDDFPLEQFSVLRVFPYLNGRSSIAFWYSMIKVEMITKPALIFSSWKSAILLQFVSFWI